MTKEDVVGVFIGLQSSSYEYIASLIAPYQTDFKPEMGSFILIDNVDSHIVARIMDYVPLGELVQPMGEKWLSDVALTPEVIGQDIKTKKICYRVKIKLLGSLKKNTKKFSPGIRELPHITSKVTCPDTDTIKQICNQALEEQTKGPQLGSYWMDKNIGINFKLNDLHSERTFIFARAGYGKSNLMKVLSSSWNPSNGGLVIFDPEGEYAITDAKGRPGIMDKIPCILITNRAALKDKPNAYTKLHFNLKNFNPHFIIPIFVSAEKHENIFFQKLMGLDQERWDELVDLLYTDKWGADNEKIRKIVLGEKGSANEQELKPIKNNLIPPILALHDPDSDLLRILLHAVSKGEVIIIDISMMDSNNAMKLCSLIVGYFFNKNQNQFIGGGGDLIKAVFVMEEAQSVLGPNSSIAKFVELAKEGRKYALGGIFITQQPGSIPMEILSQADNFFVFHLLSKFDLQALQRANAHYSDDILTQILSEPVKGKAYMWTSHQPFVLPVRIDNFEEIAKKDSSYKIQNEKKLLGHIQLEINKDDKIWISIVKKYKDYKFKLGINQRTTNQETIDLYRELSNEQLDYCRKHNGIQKNRSGDEFAIYIKFYEKIRNDSQMVESSYIEDSKNSS